MEGELLILIELLIDTVNIPTIRAIYDEILPAKTCVSFQILNLPPINIYQETPTETCACPDSGSQVFKKGKSCLFALSDNVLKKPLCNFPITMSVYKELPPGVLPDVMLIGTHQIQLHGLMNSLLSMYLSEHSNPCKTMKNAFKITTATGQHVGEVTVFIRASCFGKKIVTQFQLPRNREPYLFKGVDNGPMYQCKRVTSATDRQQISCICSPKKTGDGSGEAAIIRYSADERRRKERFEDTKKDKCSPCCRGARDIKSKEIVRKCGCIVKKE
ncbi:PREDICTED: microtubule-associated protein 10-like [Wasmannia auropunctata]|uniref:microtubule-associated protein 10-like n=1 Tax=Wasmannia auropunctata TaxID=64793 RepID=UPI0005EF76D1|nr:PREDICTED: microtubule-associated protein 10-like [Wasmannia auropunctata]XP_011694848.1 PREDICTED: microtubule-associated protein 10-like [Wasmannia auropunctata]XP_011694850.1 PREDICTED: microtubule-associated protein 10-like [Wasmannia auropunctata]